LLANRWAPWAVAAVVTAPTLVFVYLPMADLPQHLAVASILGHFHDERFGFADYYRVQLDRSPYLLPYALVILLGRAVPLTLAMRLVVFGAVFGFFAGVTMLLRRLGKPWPLVLLAVPLAYNRAFFWGFLNFYLALSLALVAMALCAAEERSRGRAVALAVLLLALSLVHVYGLLLFLGYAVLDLALGRVKPLRRAAPWAGVAALLLIPWLFTEARAPGLGGSAYPSLRDRLMAISQEVLGGYADSSEPLLLAVVAAAFLILTWRALPITAQRWRRLSRAERVLYLVFAGNVLLYFVLPRATPTAKFVHFRHAVIAVSLLPVLASWEGFERLPLLCGTLLAVAGVGGALNAWDHLRLFDAEARPFEQVIERVPERPRLLALTADRQGRLMASGPYLHFGGYVQARKGGVFSMGFPEFFWNMPVALRQDAGIPPTPVNLEWRPWLFDERAFGWFYDTVLIRTASVQPIPRSADFPFDAVYVAPPWQLYRRHAEAAR
jgi:hypothetical protein